MELLQNKVVLATGCSSGIGLATAKASLKAGANVFGVDISEPPADLQQEPNFKFQRCDIGKNSDIVSAVKACNGAFGGRIDVLFNIAGISDRIGSCDTTTDDEWDRVVAINLTGPFKVIREVLPYMRKQKSGSIVNTSSRAGLGGGISGVSYTATKHGIIGLTRNVAWRFKDEGIRCNAICPGGVQTNIFQSVMHEVDVDAYINNSPVLALHFKPEDTGSGKTDTLSKAPIEADDVAQAFVFLGSDCSSKISGITLPVDVAWSAA
ncbi:hypothetical protein LTS17_007998 [Exophiala oligosperma]